VLKWKAAVVAAVLSLGLVAGFGASPARASGVFEARFENGQFVLYNVSGMGLRIDDITYLDDGDLSEQYHAYFQCTGTIEELPADEGCTLWVEGTLGTLRITSMDLAFPEYVYLSDGS
jgi:hypothetical protein